MYQNTRHTESPTWMPVTQDDLRNLQVGGTVTPSGAGYIPISIIDLPLADVSEPLVRWRFPTAVDFAGGTADAEIAATGSPAFRIRKNGAANGTVSFSGTTGTVSFTSLSYAAGDLFELYPPASVDATLDRVSITLETT